MNTQAGNFDQAVPVPLDRHAARVQRRDARQAQRELGNGGNAIVGVMILVIGVILLSQTLGLYTFHNWWALFILVPAMGAFSAAAKTPRNTDGRLTVAASGEIIAGLVITGIAVAFLFDRAWTFIVPGLLILVGLGFIFSFLARK